jgi:hypothetical protein
MKKNMGLADRLIRTILAIVVIVLYLTNQISGTAAVILGIIAIVFLLTSAIGLCPAYLPLKLSTVGTETAPAAPAPEPAPAPTPAPEAAPAVDTADEGSPAPTPAPEAAPAVDTADEGSEVTAEPDEEETKEG